jgi:NAD(P) transhydrogenase subunit alpha
VETGGVKIYGPTNLASMVPTDASRMYARNLLELVNRLRSEEGIAVDLEDEIIGGSTIVHHGEVVHPRSRQLLGLGEVSP